MPITHRDIPELTDNDILRFWSKVHIHPGDLDACWPWKASRNKGWYGRFQVGGWRGFNAVASRVAYIIAYGRIADGLFVLHSCDNPICCNPRHLFLGTSLDNVRDMVCKGRKKSAGVHNGRAVLNESIVASIRREWATGTITQQRLSEIHDVSRSLIQQIVRGHIWKQSQPS